MKILIMVFPEVIVIILIMVFPELSKPEKPNFFI